MSGSEKRNERTTWVCGKWGLTEVIESHGRIRFALADGNLLNIGK